MKDLISAKRKMALQENPEYTRGEVKAYNQWLKDMIKNDYGLIKRLSIR